MVIPVIIGVVAAIVAAIPPIVRAGFPNASLNSPVLILGVAVIAMMLQRFMIDRRPGSRAYDGLADMMISIHSPATPDSSRRWNVRGLISLLLSVVGGLAGREGAAVEISHALSLKLRTRSAKWFEQRRRTDVATALSAGVAAAFGAPFAAILLPMELSIGGRTISSALSAITAFLTTRYLYTLAMRFHITPDVFDLNGALYGFHFMGIQEWICILVITLASGVAGAGAIRFIRYAQESLLDLFQTQAWIRTVAGGILLFLVVLVYRPGHWPASTLLERVLWGHTTANEAGLLFLTHLMSIALVLSAFGTVGILWPVFALGGFLGFGLDHSLLQGGVLAAPGFSAVAGLAGGAGLFGAILGAPIAGAVLAYEMTQNLAVLLPCLIAGLGARQIRVWLRTPDLVTKDLQARGVSLVDGRASNVLDTVFVRDAMVTDFETVHEQEPVSEIYSRLMKSRYPFLPVVNAQSQYLGLLTVDMIQEGWQAQDPLASNAPLSKLLEAKDLLYRAGFKTPTVKPNDRLSSSAKLFEEVPCTPVVNDEGRVQGLLFVYNVRLAYDRESARRALSFRVEEP